MRNGQRASLETRKRMSNAAKQRVIHWTSEMRKRRSEIAIRSNKGRILSGGTKLKISRSLTGKKLSLETRVKQSSARKERVGPNSPRWKGGVSNHPPDLTHDLHLRIKERDNFQCMGVNCTKTSFNLQMHHKDRNQWNNQFSNLVTLCASCHAKVHCRKPSKDALENSIRVNKGRKRSQEERNKISKAGKGRKFSDEHKNRISKALQGRAFSEEHRKNLSVAGKNYYQRINSIVVKAA